MSSTSQAAALQADVHEHDVLVQSDRDVRKLGTDPRKCCKCVLLSMVALLAVCMAALAGMVALVLVGKLSIPNALLADLSASTATSPTSDAGPKFEWPSNCSNRFIKPSKPSRADDHNGVALQDVCISKNGTRPYHVFIIGDWGGIPSGGGFQPAPNIAHHLPIRGSVWPPDAKACYFVRDRMRERAPASRPDYVLNIGDNFYWAGVEDRCGAKDISATYSNGGTQTHWSNHVDQFKSQYEEFFTGDGLNEPQWLGVLGNHDYGGWLMNNAWDQAIGYTWSAAPHASGRWMQPALYYSSKVWYDDFSVDYYFLDSNVFDARYPGDPSPHNICSQMHNPGGANCGATGGPSSIWNCQTWFQNLWEEQKRWLDKIVPTSTAHWRIAVTHFPPTWGRDDWVTLTKKNEFDLLITGHVHAQDMHKPGDYKKTVWGGGGAITNDFVDPTAWVISGGGGGVTSDVGPSADGNDDAYGFMDMTLTRGELKIEGITHQGQLRRTIVMKPSYPHHPDFNTTVNSSMEEESAGTPPTPGWGVRAW